MGVKRRVHALQSSQRHSSVSVAEGIDPRWLSDRQTYQDRRRGFTRTRCYSVEVPLRERAFY